MNLKRPVQSLIILMTMLLTLLLTGFASKPVSDDFLVDTIRSKLASDQVVKGGAIEVEVHDGAVVLRGKVEEEKQKDKAEKVAKKVNGVKSVKNEIELPTPDIEIEKVAAGLQFVDGLAWSRAGFLAIADVRQNKLLRLEVPTRPKVLKENDGGASGLAYDLQGRLYICESVARRISRMDRQGVVEEVVASFQGKKFNAPNDIVVRRDYHVYFTDPAFGSAADNRDLDFYGIYHIGPKGEVDIVAKWQTRPNGIALSPDGKQLYVADSDRHAIVAFDAGRNGETGNPRDVVTKVSGVPGGIKTDVDGRLYVAARGISVYSAAGKLERTLLEDENVINCAFGEADSEYLFVSARGIIFRMKLGVKGAFQY